MGSRIEIDAIWGYFSVDIPTEINFIMRVVQAEFMIRRCKSDV